MTKLSRMMFRLALPLFVASALLVGMTLGAFAQPLPRPSDAEFSRSHIYPEAPSYRAPSRPAPIAEPAPPQRWIDTPYAPMIPPVYRTEPVDVITPAIPPVAR